MGRGGAIGVACALLLLPSIPGSAGDAAGDAQLQLRVEPRLSVARPPVSVAVAAVLVGGKDLARYYCARQEWDWGDGSRSLRESSCQPFKPGMPVDRYFAATHRYREVGDFEVRFRLVQADTNTTVAWTRTVFELHEPSLPTQ